MDSEIPPSVAPWIFIGSAEGVSECSLMAHVLEAPFHNQPFFQLLYQRLKAGAPQLQTIFAVFQRSFSYLVSSG